MTSVPQWQPGTQYAPGAVVVPRSNSVVTQEQPYNGLFIDGSTNWTVTGEYCSDTAAVAAVSFTATIDDPDGNLYETMPNSWQSAKLSPTAGNGTGPNSGTGNPAAFAHLTNNFVGAVVPGQVINFRCWFIRWGGDPDQSFCSGGPRLAWYDASMNFLSYSYADLPAFGINNGGKGMYSGNYGSWITVGGSGTAPAKAAYVAAVIVMSTTVYSGQVIYAWNYSWDYTIQGYPSGLVFVAVQAAAEVSGTVEPVWPVAPNTTVYDPNTAGVEWNAEYASVVTWTTASILKTGGAEPTMWPTQIGGSVTDGTIEWVATDGRVTDSNCPQSKVVAIASAKIYAADNDIIRFSATANAADWSASNDAGFIPFGLQTYGNEPCLGLGLYRSNLVAFNSIGYQMWQVDPDPTNIAILDAEPVGCNYPKSIQPLNNDLVFLSPVGVRNIGTAGAAGNLQAGQFGKQVDPIVQGLAKWAAANNVEIKSLFYPGTGQYWLIMGKDVIALTVNGNNTMSWSHYTFPAIITDSTVMNGVLYLRAGDLVWQVDDDTLVDDYGGTNAGFRGYMAWNYIECGPMGVDKMMEGFDLTIGEVDDNGEIDNNNVTCNVSFGYNQSNREMATEPYAVTGDTIPGTLIPMPITAPSFQLRLDFGTGQDWGWAAANLYVMPIHKPGAQ